MVKRTAWILAGTIGVLVTTAGGLVIALKGFAPPQGASAVVKAIPETWTVPEATTPQLPSPDDRASGEASTLGQGFPETAPFSVHESGSLTITGDGRRFGEETYELSVGSDGTYLTSSGVFELRVLVVSVRASFTQSLTEDAAFRPTAYTLHLDAPLGFGRDVQEEIAADGAVVTRGEDGAGTRINPDHTLVLGTFSTYALIPFVFEARQREGIASFEVLTVFGPPGQRQPDDSAGRSSDELTVERLGDATILVDARELTVERYRIRNGTGDSLLFARDDEFLGFLGGDESHTLFVYRSDYFPKGFQVLR